jgi:hypothetical protein
MASPRPARSPPVHSSPRPGSPRRPSISHARVLGQISSAATADGVHLPPQASGNVGQPPDLLRSMEFPPPLLMHPSCLLVSLLPCLLVYLFVHISLDLFLVCIDAQQWYMSSFFLYLLDTPGCSTPSWETEKSERKWGGGFDSQMDSFMLFALQFYY